MFEQMRNITFQSTLSLSILLSYHGIRASCLAAQDPNQDSQPFLISI